MIYWPAFALLSWILCLLAAPVLRRAGIIDRPNERSSHSVPTVRGGGVGIVLAIAALIIVPMESSEGRTDLLQTLGLAGALAIVSFADDIRPLPAFARLAVHFVIAVGCVAQLGLGASPTIALIAVFWLCGYTNAFNFMDGINGLAAVQATVTAAGTAIIAVLAGAPIGSAPVVLSIAVSGAAGGFLPHNFPTARMFMGDVASATFGFLLATLAIWVARDHGWGLLLPLGMLHANFALDTGLTLLRRVARSERWHEAHREHFYQRLVRSGWSHARVTYWEGAILLVSSTLAVLTVSNGLAWRVVGFVSVVILWAVFFAYTERKFRLNGPAQAAAIS